VPAPSRSGLRATWSFALCVVSAAAEHAQVAIEPSSAPRAARRTPLSTRLRPGTYSRSFPAMCVVIAYVVRLIVPAKLAVPDAPERLPVPRLSVIVPLK